MFFFFFFIYSLSTKYIFAFRITVMMTNGHHWTPSAAAATGAQDVMTGMFFLFAYVNCYDSFTYFSPLIFLVYSLHAPTSCLLFLVYTFISFYRLPFLSCAALLFMHSLMHSTITHAQFCTVCLLMCSLLRHSLVI